MKNAYLILFLIIGITLTACIEGPTGPRGYDGRDGEDGEVEIYSSTVTISQNDFYDENEYVAVAEYGWDLLDESTVDEGVVLGYLRFEGTTAWHVLPLSTPFENDIVVLRYLFDIDSFNLITEGEVAGNNGINVELFDGDVLRVVAIPPSQVYKAKGLDYSNYEQVATLYGLE